LLAVSDFLSEAKDVVQQQESLLLKIIDYMEKYEKSNPDGRCCINQNLHKKIVVARPLFRPKQSSF